MDNETKKLGYEFLCHSELETLDATFSDIGYDFLAHHGREGQKWGVQNGPPYPLDKSGLKSFYKHVKEKRETKRREKILHDPKKLSKHANEFTKEEIDAAIEKIKSINEAKKLIPRDQAPDKLTKKQKQWAKDPELLMKNFDKFSPKQLEMALAAENAYGNLKYRKINKARVPKEWFDLGVDYLRSFANLGQSLVNIRTNYKNLFNIRSDEELANTYSRTAKNLRDLGVKATMSPESIEMYKRMGINVTDGVIKGGGGGKGGKGGITKEDLEELLKKLDD